jgi:cell division septation protein DedD
MASPDRSLYEPPYDDALLYDTEAEPERPRSQSLVVMLGFVVVAAFAGVVWVAYNYGVSEGRRDGNPPVLAGEPGPYQVSPEQHALNEAADDPVVIAPEKSYDELWEDGAETAGASSTDPEPGADRSAPLPAPTEGMGGDYRPAAVDPRLDSTLELGDEAAIGPQAIPPTVDDATSPASPATGRPASTTPKPSSSTSAIAMATPPAAPAAAAPKPLAPKAITPAPVGRPEPVAPAIAPEVAVTQPAASPASSGGVSIQLGAFPSSDLAAAHWSRVKGQNEALLSGYSPRFMQVDLPGKGTLYRLRVAGFPDKSAAKSVCDQIVAGGGACILAGK